MKINQEMKRKIVQVAAFGYSNTYIGNFVSGQIYKGRWKQFCNPGMNCYSCPAARLACPIGAMQAVSGSMNFKLSFYVIGFVLALGVVFGVQWNCVVPSHFCGITHSRTDGNSENHAPGGILLGICADEYSFRISLEHGSWTVPQTL